MNGRFAIDFKGNIKSKSYVRVKKALCFLALEPHTTWKNVPLFFPCGKTGYENINLIWSPRELFWGF